MSCALAGMGSQRILDRATDASHAPRADAANALGERPGVAGVPALEDQLQAAHHGARSYTQLLMRPSSSVSGLDAQMPLYAGDGVDSRAPVPDVVHSPGVVSLHEFKQSSRLVFCPI